MHENIIRLLAGPLFKKGWILEETYGTHNMLTINGGVSRHTAGDQMVEGDRGVAAGFRLSHGYNHMIDGPKGAWRQVRALWLEDGQIVVAFWTWKDCSHGSIVREIPDDPLPDIAALKQYLADLAKA